MVIWIRYIYENYFKVNAINRVWIKHTESRSERNVEILDL